MFASEATPEHRRFSITLSNDGSSNSSSVVGNLCGSDDCNFCDTGDTSHDVDALTDARDRGGW